MAAFFQSRLDRLAPPEVDAEEDEPTLESSWFSWAGNLVRSTLIGEQESQEETETQSPLPEPGHLSLEQYMRKADFGRLVLMDANLQQANRVRNERGENKRFVQEQRERFRQRGVALRAERLQTEAAVAGAVDSCHQNARFVGETLRNRQKGLRQRRQMQEKDWERHGRWLTEKYSTRGNQELVRTLKKEVAEEKARVGTELRCFLKQAKKDTDDTIAEVNRERVERVYAETAHPVVRRAKQTIIGGRWDKADNVRMQVAGWRRQMMQNQAEYLERAWTINDSTQKPEDYAVASQKRHEQRVAYARQQTQWRKDIAAQRKAVAEGVRRDNRSVHDSVDYGQLIPEQVVAGTILSSSPRGGGEDPISMFTRFFGFKKTQRPPPTAGAPRPTGLVHV
jgi:hypothetical protein